MAIQKLGNQDAFNAKVQELVTTAADNKKWIHDDMKCATKTGRFWRVLSSLLRIIGIDVFGHVRVNKVAEKMLDFARLNTDYLNADNAGKLLGVMSKLDQRTHKKYHKTVEYMKLAIKGLLPDQLVKEPMIGPPPPPPKNAFKEWEVKQKGAWKTQDGTTTDEAGDKTPTSTPKTQKKNFGGNGVAVDIAQEALKRRQEMQKKRAQKQADGQQKPATTTKKAEVQQHDFRKNLKRTDTPFRLQVDPKNQTATTTDKEQQETVDSNPDATSVSSQLSAEQQAKMTKRMAKVNQ